MILRFNEPVVRAFPHKCIAQSLNLQSQMRHRREFISSFGQNKMWNLHESMETKSR